jgi:hypothetical protein
MICLNCQELDTAHDDWLPPKNLEELDVKYKDYREVMEKVHSWKLKFSFEKIKIEAVARENIYKTSVYLEIREKFNFIQCTLINWPLEAARHKDNR